ncbi:UNVERIFIED_CONTAM: hypothetical protein H355_006150, partial [Colinus virginianus]
DDTNAPYPDDWMEIAFVPWGKPRGPLGGLPEWSHVPELGVDARGSERWKKTLERGKYPQRLSHAIKKIMKDKAARVLPREVQHNRIYDPFLKNPEEKPLKAFCHFKFQVQSKWGNSEDTCICSWEDSKAKRAS